MKHPFLLIAVLCCSFCQAQPNFEVPKAFPIDEKSKESIQEKTSLLIKAIDSLPKNLPVDVVDDVEIYRKAAEWMVRHGEYFTKDTVKQTLTVLDVGLARAKAAAEGKSPWRMTRGRSVIRAYRSHIDGSLQPYSVSLPEGFGSSSKAWRIDVVLHGRDGTLSEVKFLSARENSKNTANHDRIVIEVYGRGNNAFRWAGERDVYEALAAVQNSDPALKDSPVFLRGFSMGGAGAWHIGLHAPSRFRAISPGAGFTTTHGYIKNLPPKLPDYQEKCLTIYDAVNYAENALQVPVIAYSGEIDGQKAAADNIENALKKWSERTPFQHFVAPGLAHKQPPEWLKKIDLEFEKALAQPHNDDPERVRFVTYTLRYPDCEWVAIEGLKTHYQKAIIDAVRTSDRSITVKTSNITRFRLTLQSKLLAPEVVVSIDDQEVRTQPPSLSFNQTAQGKWIVDPNRNSKPRKQPGQQGPIDDVFHTSFVVSEPKQVGWSEKTDRHIRASLDRFEYDWDKYFRANLPKKQPNPQSVILFGDPESNPDIAAILPNLPITWTSQKLIVNGVEYDSHTHIPVMIYPNPKNEKGYFVINSGHTFRAADLKGTNALLYPRLGDWAVLRLIPTKDDPAAAEVVAAGLLDENWQFQKTRE